MAEGVDSLTTRELQAACQSRGIRTGGVSPARLRSELAQWLELNLTYAIPSSLLILSRAFSFSDSKDLATPVEALQATLSSLPDSLLTETELHVSELEGAATPQQKLEVLEQQEELIADELAQEEKEEKARKARKEEAKLKKEADEKEKQKQEQEAAAAAAQEEAVTEAVKPAEPAPTTSKIGSTAAPGAPATLAGAASELLTDAQVAAQVEKAAGATAATEQVVQAGIEAPETTEEDEDKARMTEEQLLELREALSIMSSRSAVLEEREELEDLKEDRMEYKEDIEELAQVQRKEHKVSRRLGSRLEKMIQKLDLELQAYDADVGNKLQAFQANERGELTVADIEAALKVIKHAPDADNIKSIVKRLDIDGDGLVLLSHISELADMVEEEEGTGVLVEGKKIAIEEVEKKLKKEDVLKDE
ncbi:hypothetical protein BGZ52_004517 [Haplosporangium bisporale]|nr:hypothetical protein BGZ52_004517 [Haplosporangium bisporale]